MYEWHLGFIDCLEDDKAMVRYFTKASRDNVRWNAPEEEKVHETFLNQIICKLDDLAFISGNTIRCSLSKEHLKTIQSCFDNFLKNI